MSMYRPRRVVAALALAGLCVTAASCRKPTHVYFTSHGNKINTLQRCPLDSPRLESVVEDTGPQFGGLAVSSRWGRILWASNRKDWAIFATSFDGGYSAGLVPGEPHEPVGSFAVDEMYGELYYAVSMATQERRHQIRRINFKERKVHTVVDMEPRVAVSGLALDVPRDRMYWFAVRVDASAPLDDRVAFHRRSWPCSLWRADLSGGHRTCLIPESAGLKGAVRIALDTKSQQLYWTKRSPDSIQCVSLAEPGCPVRQVWPPKDRPAAKPQVKCPFGIGVDRHRGRVYWADVTAYHIAWAAFDGSAAGVLVKVPPQRGTEPYPTCLGVLHSAWGPWPSLTVSGP
ncbi:MAG: hypothetical protein ISS72_08980 [Candidatus Brocadiae bacterium]|nr:hypothetical protein [Candidatus Brocadiia bacterium]